MLVTAVELATCKAESVKDNIIAALVKISISQKFEIFQKDFFIKSVFDPIFANIPLKADPRLNVNVFTLFENMVFNEACIMQYLGVFEAYADKVFGFFKFMILNEFLCGIDRILLAKVKVFLEVISVRSPFFGESFKKLMDIGFENEEEKNKFNSAFLNL